MANVQLEKGYVRIANRLFEAILHAPFSGSHLKVVGGILRLTYGWRQKTVRISMRELGEAVGLASSGGFRRAFAELIDEGVVVELEPARGRAAGVYMVNKNHEQWGRFAVYDATLDKYFKARPPRQQYGGHASYVYYARAGDLVKIGLSRDPWLRVKNMRTARPGITLVAIEPGGTLAERGRHEMFAEHRVEGTGEWFVWCPAIKAHITANRLDQNIAPPDNRPKEGAYQAPPIRPANRPARGVYKEVKSPRMGGLIAPVETPHRPSRGGSTSVTPSPLNELRRPTEIERQEIQTTTTTAVGAEAGNEEEQEVTQYAGKMAAAMNAAITARWGEQPNIVRYTTGLQLAEDLVREGVSLDLACGAIASACARSKMPRPPSALEYMRNPIRQAVEEATQREFNAADTTPMAKRGGAPKAIGAAGDEEGERKRYDAERREAGMAWGKAHEPEARAIELALNETYGALLTTSGFVRETRDKQLVIECAKRAGFPDFDGWKRTRPPPTLTLVQGGKPA